MKKILTTILTALALTMLAGCGAGEPAGAGTYELQKDGLEAEFMKAVPEAMRANKDAMAAMKKMVDGISGSVTLKADGTAERTIKMPGMMGGDPTEDKAGGTWKLEGEKITITAKNEKGEEETFEGTLKDGALNMVVEKDGQKVSMNFKAKAK